MSPSIKIAATLKVVNVKVFSDAEMSKQKVVDSCWEYTRQYRSEFGTGLTIGVEVRHWEKDITRFDVDLFRTDYELTPDTAKQITKLWDRITRKGYRRGFKKETSMGGLRACLGMEVPREFEDEARAALIAILQNVKNYQSVRQ